MRFFRRRLVGSAMVAVIGSALLPFFQPANRPASGQGAPAITPEARKKAEALYRDIYGAEHDAAVKAPPAEKLKFAKRLMDDSDRIAHFIQVDSQIRKSSWHKAPCTFTTQGGKVLSQETEFPSAESFVYAAVYLRQCLFSGYDKLFQRVQQRYSELVDSDIKASYVIQVWLSFEAFWKGPCRGFVSCTVEELVEAFLYGAGIVHPPPGADAKPEFKANRVRVAKLLKEHGREAVIYELNSAMRFLCGYVSNAAAVIWQDYARWVRSGIAPKPDVFWHEQLFASS